MFYGDFERGELFFSVGLHLVPRGLLVDGTKSSIMALLGSNRLCPQLFPLAVLFRRAVGCALDRVLNLDILQDPKENVPHLGDFVLQQVLVESTCNPLMNDVAAMSLL